VLLASSVRGLGGGEGWYLWAARELAKRGHAALLAPRRHSALEYRARAAGLAVRPVRYGGLLDPRPVLALHEILREQGTEIVVANLEKELWHAALAALPLGDLVLVNRRGSPIPIRGDARRRWLYRRVRQILLNDPGGREALLASAPFLSPGRVTVLENGLDPLPEPPSGESLDWPPGEGARLVAVGQLAPHKDALGLLGALAQVRRPWRLLWLGRGPLAGAFDELAAELGLASRVRRLGWVEGARRWAREADCLLHFSAAEGQSWAVLEALVEGTPVICARGSGWDELLGEAAGACLVEPGDGEGLARAVEGFLADPGTARARAWALAGRVRASHGTARQAAHLEAFLERVRFASRGRRRVLFLDRDGTLTAESGALGRPEALALLPGVAQGLRALAAGGFEFVVVTNQAAVGRGLLSEEALGRVHRHLRHCLRRESVELAAILHCPHRPEEGCACRKPEPGLLYQARDRLGLDLRHAWLVGDSTRDVLAAGRAGVRSILLQSGWGGRDPAGPTGATPTVRLSNFRQAAAYLLER
jgi:histidinol-phosphate phosphatase family protein